MINDQRAAGSLSPLIRSFVQAPEETWWVLMGSDSDTECFLAGVQDVTVCHSAGGSQDDSSMKV